MAFSLLSYHAPDFKGLGLAEKPDAVLRSVLKDGVAPQGYHAMSIFPEYFKINGKWILAEESRMDCVAVYDGAAIQVKEFRNLKRGDQVVIGRTEDGSEGIFLWAEGFSEKKSAGDVFAFRQQRSRETAFSKDYDDLKELLEYEKEHGYVVWVMGPAFSFDAGARQAFSKMIAHGYVDALLAGNALATHDLEGAYLHTALGQDIYTRENVHNGHYNHLDTINRVNECGSVADFLNKEKIEDGIIYQCEKNNIPYVLAGSIRDDGPLAPVFGNVYEAQDAMRKHVKKATTVICMATMLHTIAVGNMTPSYRVLEDGTVRQVYFYCVDISEFTVNKLSDRGSLSSRGIVTNVQDFIVKLSRELGL
ncbi:hypothetical protein [uncultured Ruthenibacterium sp.]|uniref:ornithine cyclodeaminase family domain n=1 Tax=uncultured Ruthenibacterium sp. TaxID=1905347 RepID=UPI00349E89A9